MVNSHAIKLETGLGWSKVTVIVSDSIKRLLYSPCLEAGLLTSWHKISEVFAPLCGQLETVYCLLGSRDTSKRIGHLVSLKVPTLKLFDCIWVIVWWVLYLNISVISAIASFEAVGMMEERGVAENWGNLKFIPAASLKPKHGHWFKRRISTLSYKPSGQSLLSGVPRTEQILKISSISEFPGNSGLKN